MAITFGNTANVSNITTYLDSVFAQSIALYRKTLTDNIGASNALLYDLIKGDSYESAEGGLYFEEPLMVALADADSYDGYDELSTLPTDGVSAAIYEWRQMASPIVYNMREVIQNKARLIDLVKTRIKQSEMGIQEAWAKAFMWGNYPNALTAASLFTPRVSPANASLGVEPLTKLISFNATAGNLTVGNILESTANAWWKPKNTTSAATTYSGFMLELESMYNSCALGTGGPPTHILMDQTTYQLFIHAYFSIYRANPDALDNGYPFVGKKFLNAKVIMDDKVPDVYTGAAGTQTGGVVDPSTMTYGTAFFINDKFFKVRYQPERDWELLTDENGKSFVKPLNGDSRVGHMAWMGQCTCNNRRKQGVIGKIARTLT